jgi:hypothetical protein
MCSFLSSSGITRLLRYYEAIRLPVPHLPSSLFSCPAYSRYSERDAGPPGLPCNHSVKHAMVLRPRGSGHSLPLAEMPVLTSTPNTVSSFPTRQLRGSIPSTLRLTACLLAVLRLKLTVVSQPPRTRYPVDGLPSGAGGGFHPLDYATLPGRTVNCSRNYPYPTVSPAPAFRCKTAAKYFLTSQNSPHILHPPKSNVLSIGRNQDGP